MPNDYQLLAKRSRQLAQVGYWLLLLLLLLNTVIFPSCNREPNWVVLAVQSGLVLVFLPGMLKENVKSYIWLSLILLMMFLASVSTAFACTTVLTVAEVLLIVALFIAAMLYIRWRSRELQQVVKESER